MAGMFYSLQEAAEKLGISEEELKQWAKDGKLRDFRDGQSVMFKVDEVEALMGQSDLDDLDIPALEPDSADDDLLDLEPALDLDLGDEELEPVADLEVEGPVAVEQEAELDLAEPLELASEEPVESEDGMDDLMLALDEDDAPAAEVSVEEAAEDDLLLAADDDEQEPALNLSDTQLIGDDVPTASAEEDDLGLGDDLLLAETGAGDDALSDLTNMDTALASEGVDIFGGSEAEFKLSDDSMAETMAGLAETGGASSLEEIEDDVNLDSFGSGSGLLDLSLQADDTSLGGILDEIYTAEDGEGAAEEGSIEDMTEAAESLPMDDMPLEAAVPMMASAVVAEIPVDAQSNFFGGLLFFPLFVLLFTSIAALGGMTGGMSALMATLKGLIWYVVGGLVVFAIILSAVGFTRGGGSGGAKPKKAKAKKEKNPRAKKEKKVKEKKPKKPKKPRKKK